MSEKLDPFEDEDEESHREREGRADDGQGSGYVQSSARSNGMSITEQIDRIIYQSEAAEEAIAVVARPLNSPKEWNQPHYGGGKGQFGSRYMGDKDCDCEDHENCMCGEKHMDEAKVFNLAIEKVRRKIKGMSPDKAYNTVLLEIEDIIRSELVRAGLRSVGEVGITPSKTQGAVGVVDFEVESDAEKAPRLLKRLGFEWADNLGLQDDGEILVEFGGLHMPMGESEEEVPALNMDDDYTRSMNKSVYGIEPEYDFTDEEEDWDDWEEYDESSDPADGDIIIGTRNHQIRVWRMENNERNLIAYSDTHGGVRYFHTLNPAESTLAPDFTESRAIKHGEAAKLLSRYAPDIARTSPTIWIER